MKSQWTEWLRLARSAGHGGAMFPPIVRGLPEPYKMYLPFDAAGDSFTMTARLSPDGAGDPVLTFTTNVGTFDGDYTEVEFIPDPAKFAALPGDSDGDGMVELVADILWDSLGEVRRFIAGNFYISGKVS